MRLFSLDWIKIKHMPEGLFWVTFLFSVLFFLWSKLSKFTTTCKNGYIPWFPYCLYSRSHACIHICRHRFNSTKILFLQIVSFILSCTECVLIVLNVGVPCQQQQMALLRVLQGSEEHLWKAWTGKASLATPSSSLRPWHQQLV